MADEDVVTLGRPGSAFPVAVAKKVARVNLAEASAAPMENSVSGYRFGISGPGVAAALRLLADDIEASPSRANVQDVTVTTKAALDEFLMHTLTIIFAAPSDPKGA